MSTRIPDEIPKYWNTEEMNGVVRCLREAGWIDGEIFAGEKIFKIHLSVKGKAQMRRLSGLLMRYSHELSGPSPETPQSSDSSEQVSAIFERVYMGPLSIVPELFSFSFGDREKNAFMGLMIACALENQVDDSSGV